MTQLTKFTIKKLHGNLDFDLQFKDNTLILIGENGTCKTTIIKMLFCLLSMQWRKLSAYNFESLTIEINGKKNILKYEDIKAYYVYDERFLRQLPSSIRREYMMMQENNNYIDIERLEYLCNRHGLPYDYFLNQLEFDDGKDFIQKGRSKKQQLIVHETMESIKAALGNIHILYLPTYRRIEQELKVVLDGRGNNDDLKSKKLKEKSDCNFTELVEFGMNDVVEARDLTLNTLKDFFRESLNSLTLSYLGDVVDKKYSKVDVSPIKDVSQETIESIMSRVDENILSKQSKAHLSETLSKIQKGNEPDEHDEVVCHYFIKLLKSHQELEHKEIKIRQFSAVCSKYLKNKTLDYDSSNFTFTIKSNIDKEHVIELHQLSSGEKQIVSLFSHLYLSEKKNYFVLIDEPELSLSVKWQKDFLVDIKNGGFCEGLVAVTHSPFIFDNELDSYARGLGEFTKYVSL